LEKLTAVVASGVGVEPALHGNNNHVGIGEGRGEKIIFL